MGENPSPPYRVTRAQEPDSATPRDVLDTTRALAHRLRLAAATPWDGDTCDQQATEFVAQLTARGWTPPRPLPPAWLPNTTTPATPTTAQRAAAQARAAIHANRGNAAGTPLPATHSAAQGEGDPKSADNTTTPQNGVQR